jgi:hypothetical protein
LKVHGELEKAQLEGFTTATFPVPGMKRRIAFDTDKKQSFIDTGTQWVPFGAGGGGGSLKWVEGDNSPAFEHKAPHDVYTFTESDSNVLRVLLYVPSGFSSGTIPTLKCIFTAPNTGTYIFDAKAYLIKADVTDIFALGIPHTDTQGITILGGEENTAKKVKFDLASALGEINTVPIAEEDLIFVEIIRTDAATGDIDFLPNVTKDTYI